MPLTGNEIILVQGLAGNNQPAATTEATTTAAVSAIFAAATANTLTNVAGFTLTAAQIAGSLDVTLLLTGTLTGGANIQLPTVAALAALLPTLATSLTGYNLKIVNASSGNFAWTVTTNTGWTLAGTMSIAQNTTRSFIAQFTSATAATLTTTGTGTYS